MLRRDDDGHALLRFGDGKLRAVEAVVFFRHGVQVDAQPVGQLADGHGYAARAEIVAAADHARGLAVSKQALELALDRRVALLHLGPAAFERLERVRFRRTGRAAAAVAPRAPAEQDHNVARHGALAHNMRGWRRADNRADFKALGRVAGMIDLGDMAGRQPDLVAVGAVPRGGRRDDFALRQLAGQRFGQRHGRVGRAGHAHRLIDVAAPGKRIADRPAQAGRRAAERLDLRRVVVRFVFEHEQPVLLLAVDVDLDFHGTGVDFLAFVQLAEQTLRPQRLRADHGQVHQRHRLVLAGVKLCAQLLIFFKALADVRRLDAHIFNVRQKCRMAAVVRPVGVDHADLRDRRVAALRIFKVVLAEGDVAFVHRQAVLFDKAAQPRRVKLYKAIERFDRRRDIIARIERLWLFKRGKAAFDRVDKVALDLLQRLAADLAGQDKYARRAHGRPRFCKGERDALRARIGALVELAGQVFDGEHALVFGRRGQLVVGDVDLRFGKNGAARALEVGFVDMLDVIAVENAHALDTAKPQNGADIGEHTSRLDGKGLLFFHVDAIDAHVFPSIIQSCRASGASVPTHLAPSADVIRTRRIWPRRSSSVKTRTGV